MELVAETIKALVNKSFTTEELDAAGDRMHAKLIPWVFDRWPKISDECIKKNLPELTRIHEYDIACHCCMGVQMCLSKDAMRMQGGLAFDGYMNVWMENCPHGYCLPRRRQEADGEYTTPVKSTGWRKSR